MTGDHGAPPHQQEPLPSMLRARIWVVAACSALLFLMTAPLFVLGLARRPPATGLIWVSIAVGVVLPALFGILMWRQVRRWRRDPEVRRRQLDPSTQRLLLVGNLVVLVIAQVVRGLSGLPFWPGLGVGLVVVLAGSYLVTRIARRRDPRVHFLRRPDPVADGDPPRPR